MKLQWVQAICIRDHFLQRVVYIVNQFGSIFEAVEYLKQYIYKYSKLFFIKTCFFTICNKIVYI